MSSRVVDANGDSIVLEERELAVAHGALGWDFPEGEGDERIETWPARGDVIRDEVTLCTGEAAGVRWRRESLREAWARGEVVLPPWVIHHAFGGDEVQSWQVAPSVRMLPVRTPTLPPATHTNTFLVGADVFVLIEPAPVDPAEQDLLRRWVDDARKEGRRCEAVLATHHHHDHVGGASLAAELGVPLWAHEETASRVSAPVGRLLRDGERIALGEFALDVVFTPGHAPGHLCFVEPKSGTAIVGDMVAGVGTILVEPGEGDMSLYLDSLRKLRSVGARKMLPAHGGVIADPAAWIDHYVAHRLAREAKVRAALTAEPQSVETLVAVVYADTPRALWGLAALSLRAHLEKLVRDGDAVDDGGWRVR